MRGERCLEVFGTGEPLRQFCFTPDLALLLLWTLLQPSKVELIALVPEEECTIRKLAETVAKEFGLPETKFDASKADGQFRKTMSNATLRSLLPSFKFTSLEEGIRATAAAYRKSRL